MVAGAGGIDAGGFANLLRTNGSARSFTDEPVPDDVVRAILDDARFAPSGGNRQPWKVAVVRDRAIRRTIGGMMQVVWNEYVASSSGGSAPFAPGSGGTGSAPTGPAPHTPNALIDHIETVPVVLAVAADLNRIAVMDRGLGRVAISAGASIYPFCWSVLLAAHQRGLGGVLTTFLTRAEEAAAPVLGLPDGYALAATLFLGHTEHRPTKLRRNPVESFTTVDRFDGPPL